ncbi:MAG: DUF3068 domain-containing protein, partial [Candidatus Peregrinibacteria bacterium]|nr:DUF3068 domain-containing protein [Candidatus Peregrinibacteria bacterium]
MQRRTRMIVIGSILLTAYAGWMYQVVPWLERIPDNFYYSSDIVSIDNFFDHNAQAYEGPIYSKTRFYYGISGKKDNDVLLIRNVFDVRTPDGKPIISIEREYGVNAKTGKHVKGFGDKNREGYLFAPRRLRKGKSFTHWHINYDGPAEMEYVRDEEIYGLTVRLYKANYNNVPIDQTQDLEYIPGVGTEYGIELEPHLQLWVEPITGQIVKYADDTIAYYYDLKTHERLWPWNHFTNVVSEQSVEKNVQNAYTTRVQWRLISTVSIILLLAGLWILSAATGCIRIFQQHTSLNGFAWLFGMSAITTASFILLQWSIGKIWLSLPIQPITAACIILLAGSYLLRTKFRGILSLAMSTILVVITGIFLAEFLFGLPVFIDHFLLPHHAQTSDAPQRMSLYCALCFFLLGLVPLVAPIRALRPLRLLHILPLSVALLSLFAILTVLLDIHSAYISTFFASVQLLSAIVFLCFSIIMHGMYWESSYKTLWSKQWLVMSSILFGCISTTIIFTGLASQSFANDAKVSFDLQINNATNAIAERLHIYINALEGGIGLFESSDRVEREEFYT